MKFAILLAGVLTAGVSSLSLLGNTEAQASAGVCLKVRDLGSLKPIDDTTTTATSRSQGNFIVKFRGPCRDFRFLDNFYTVRVLNQNECFDSNDVLEFRYGGLCFVQSVTPVFRN